MYDHRLYIEKIAISRMKWRLPALAKDASSTVKLKPSDQMEWVDLMNACNNYAEEIIKAELVYN